MGDSGYTDLAGLMLKLDNAEMNTEVQRLRPRCLSRGLGAEA